MYTVHNILLALLLFLFKSSLQFSEKTVKFAVSEDASVGSIIGKLEPQAGLSYRLSRGNSKIRFDDQTLELSVSAPLDRESEDMIDMLIITSPPTIIHLLVDVLDVNDNAPRFPVQVQRVTIPETASIGWRVSISGATDPDSGENGTIGGYALEDTQAPFSIVTSDGLVFLEVTDRLDREQIDAYSTRLTATDRGVPPLSSSCLLNILILDTNDNPPNFGIRSVAVDWNGEPNIGLFRLNATDADVGDNGLLIYQILGDDGLFTIDEENILTTTNSTTCSPRCHVVVEARDSGVPPLSSTLNVVVSVVYGNEHEPNINIRFYPSEFPFIVVDPEDVNGKTLAILSITDADGPLGKNASIWLESGDLDSIFSLISRQSINILTLKHVENARKEHYSLKFGANDGQKPPKTSYKPLEVFFKKYAKPTNIHVAPEIHVAVERDIVPGSFVAHVLTNCSEACRFEMAANSDVFRIDETNGIVVTSSRLPEGVGSFHLPIRIRLPAPSFKILESEVFVEVKKATAPKSLIRSAEVEVHLKRSYTFATWHNVSVGTVIGRLPKGQIYSTSDTQSELGIFPDGAIFVGKPIVTDMIHLPVVLEYRNTTQKSLVTVVVRPVNEKNPVCHAAKVHVAENTLPGSVIGRLHSSSEKIISYKLLNSEDDVAYVEQSTGKLRSRVAFDAERKRTYTLNYQLMDYEHPRKSTNCSSTIVVEDVNDNCPQFSSRYYSAKISGSVNTTVVIVQAKDEDVEEKNRHVEYRLLNFNDYFHVDKLSGRITIKKSIPRTFHRLNLTVEAVNSLSDNFLATRSFVLISVVKSDELIVGLKSLPLLKVYRDDVAGMHIGRVDVTSSESTIWSVEDERFFINSHGDFILKKFSKSTKPFDLIMKSHSGAQKLFRYQVQFVNSERNDSVDKILEAKKSGNNTFDLSDDWKNWKIVKTISTNDTYSIDSFDQILIGSENPGNFSESYVFLESVESPSTFKIVHFPGTSEESDALCFPSVHLVTPPATVPLPANCTNVTLQNQKTLSLQIHSDSLLVPSQSELVAHVDLISQEQKKPFMMTLIKDSPTDDVRFASSNVLMLLSSVHTVDSSFGRVTAESQYRIRYYLVGSDHVSIDADTGELFLRRRFYRNLNDILIVAVIPTGIAKAKVTIEVIEDRLYLPKSNFVVFAPNSLRPDSPLGTISVGRDDAIVDVINDDFYVRRTEIFAKKHFHPTTNFYDVEGVVKKGKLSAPINVTVFFGNSGDVDDDVRENELKFEVEENSPIGTVVGVVPNNRHSKYRLVDPTCGLLIDQDGVIRTTTLFDREKTSLLKTKMIEPSANRIWDLLVLIGDVNDNKPRILNAPRQVQVSNAAEFSYKLMWEDADDVATDVSFAIVDGDYFGHLKVDDFGEMTFASRPSESFNATVRIYDNRPPFAVNSEDVTIHFHVALLPEDVRCENASFWIFGRHPQQGDVVGTMTSSENVTWRIVPRSVPRGEFVIDSMSGEIRISEENERILKNGDVFELQVQIFSFDAEKTGFCTARITVEDLTSSEVLKVDNTTLEFSVSETTNRGTEIGRVQLKTPSTDVIWRILNNDVNFTISPFDGTLFTNSPLDFEDVNVYKIHVAVEKIGVPESSTSAGVLIKVLDENDEAPRFVTGDTVHLKVREELTTVAYPLIIGSSIAEDLDEGINGVVTYSILAGNLSLFAVNSTSGDILSLKPLDREESEVYELEIEAKDAGIPSLTATSRIVIHVEDVNDNTPEFTQNSYRSRVSENIPLGTRVLKVTAIDKDQSAELQYSLDSEVRVPFRIDVATGWITVAGPIDREERDEYSVAVVVKDGEKTARSTVTIVVDDVNDNWPVIENEKLDVFVPDDVAPGQIILVIDVHDSDRNDVLKFSLNGSDADFFRIGEKGEMEVTRKLPSKPYFSVEVSVSDDVGHATSSEYTFYRHPHRDFPVWKEKMETVSVREHETQELAIFKASGQGVRYSVVSRCQEHLGVESISGILAVNNTLDREQFTECPVFIIATSYLENKPLSVITKMLIKIVDTNDNSPIFEKQLYHFNLTENSGPSTVGTIRATDSDSGDNSRIHYEIVGGDPQHEFLVTDVGEIQTIRDLDRESNQEYRLTVEAIDDGKPRRRGNTSVIVRVLDEDDNAPRFSRIFHAEIPEDAAIGTFVIQLSASDADETSNHHFGLESVGEPCPFRVEENSGKVFVNDTLDFEKKSSYRIKVRLTDGVWLIETSLFVTVKDVNDNFPIFDSKEYFMISNSTSRILGQVQANDSDSGTNGRVRYSTTSPFFRIDPDSGVITRIGPLSDAMTSLEVVASDHGVPRLQETATVRVAELSLFDDVREEAMRGTTKQGDVIGEEMSGDAEILPRGSATIDGKKLILSSDDVEEFWILKNLTLIHYTKSNVSEVESSDNTEGLIRVEVNSTVPISQNFFKLESPGCSNFKPVNSTVQIDRNGWLKLLEMSDQKLEVVCNDGLWPERNQVLKLEILTSETSSDLFTPSYEHQKKHKKRLPKNLKFRFDPNNSGTVLWKNTERVEMSMVSNPILEIQNGDVLLKTSESEASQEVFVDGFRRSTITIIPDKNSCPQFPEKSYFFEKSGNSSEIHEFDWQTSDDCQIRILNNHNFHVNGSKLFALKPLPSGVYQFKMVSESKPTDDYIFSECDVTVTVPIRNSEGEEDDLPSVIFFRENQTSSPHNPLLRLPPGFQLADVSHFSMTASGAVWSRTGLQSDRVYRVPVVQNGQKKTHLVRVLLDGVMDSDDKENSPNAKDDEIEDVSLQKSAIELEIVGKRSAISNLIQDLKNAYDDMKIYCLSAWQSSSGLKHHITFAIIDRNDVIVAAPEVQRTLTSFLEKRRPTYLDFVAFHTDQCDDVICVEPNSTCQTVLVGGSKRLISRSGDTVFSLPVKKLVGKCECEGDCGMEEIRRTYDDVIDASKNCDDVDCGGGECVVENSRPVCRCVDGKSAFESLYDCRRVDDVFSLNSEGHLDLKLRNSSTEHFPTQQIELDFRTVHKSSSILNADFGNQHAYIEVASGVVSFSLADEFTRPIETRIEKRVDDGRWHRLLIQMTDDGRKISIQVDGRGKEVKSRVRLPMMFTAKSIRLATSSEFCFRRLLVQNQFVHPDHLENRFFEVSAYRTSSKCASDPVTRSANLSNTTTLVLLSVLALISLIGLLICFTAIRRRLSKKSTEKRSGWKKATEIDAFAVQRHRGHVNRSMVRSPDEENYEVTSAYGTQMKNTSTDEIYTTASSRRYVPPVPNRRDGHINMAYL